MGNLVAFEGGRPGKRGRERKPSLSRSVVRGLGHLARHAGQAEDEARGMTGVSSETYRAISDIRSALDWILRMQRFREER